MLQHHCIMDNKSKNLTRKNNKESAINVISTCTLVLKPFLHLCIYSIYLRLNLKKKISNERFFDTLLWNQQCVWLILYFFLSLSVCLFAYFSNISLSICLLCSQFFLIFSLFLFLLIKHYTLFLEFLFSMFLVVFPFWLNLILYLPILSLFLLLNLISLI